MGELFFVSVAQILNDFFSVCHFCTNCEQIVTIYTVLYEFAEKHTKNPLLCPFLKKYSLRQTVAKGDGLWYNRGMKNDLLSKLRDGHPLSLREQITLTASLSYPAILAQLSSIIMQYIDAAMVGRLGADASAAIGLVSSSTWLFNGVLSAAVTGFTVQAAQYIGAKDQKSARCVMKGAFIFATLAAVFMATLGAAVSSFLPRWLSDGAAISRDAGLYFLVFALSLPFVQLNTIAGGMLQASGNMKVPSALHVLMCALDVVFNLIFIFPSREILGIPFPGAGLGVMGAAMGTALSQVVVAVIMLAFLLLRSPELKIRRGEHLSFTKDQLKRACAIGLPIAAEQAIMCSAYVASTKIVAPIGSVAIAANSFAITAESLCYMPGYGIGNAATTLIGQSVGAGRRDLTRRLGWITTLLGICVMTVVGVLMWFAAPYVIGLLSPDRRVVELATGVLRMEVFAEPMYAASIVALGVFRGAGDTLAPSCMSFISMWAVRISLAAILTPHFGLYGYWIAMTVELVFRGVIFLIRLGSGKWLKEKKL